MTEFNLSKERQKLITWWSRSSLNMPYKLIELLKRIKEQDKEFIKLLKEELRGLMITKKTLPRGEIGAYWDFDKEIDNLAGDELI